MGTSFLAARAELVPEGTGRVAAQRDRDHDERNPVHGLRFQRRFPAGRSAGDHRIFSEPAESCGWPKTEFWSSHRQQLAQCKRLRAYYPGPELARAAIRHGRPQCGAGASVHELGFLNLQGHSPDRIQRVGVPGGVLQYPQSHELPSAEQRHQLTDLQSHFEGRGSETDSVWVEIPVLSEAGAPTFALGRLGRDTAA